MGLMAGKTAVIFGVANKRSIAWGITKALLHEGARVALNFQNERMEGGVRKLAAELPEDIFVAQCDVTRQEEIEGFFAAAYHRDFDFTSDGERLVMVFPGDQTEPGDRFPNQINVVLNWFQELTERVPVP